MGISDLFSDMISSLGFPEAQAEAPAENNDQSGQEESEPEGKEEETPAEEEGEKGEEGGEEEEEEGEEEEEEEEEEVEDIKPVLEEECAKSSHCGAYKHHYDECAERVMKQEEDEDYKGPKEDCVEEFFHLAHCATQCAAPKLFKAIK